MITHNGLIDLSLLLDQHLLAEQSLNKEWDREVDVAIQVDEWDRMWYNALEDAAEHPRHSCSPEVRWKKVLTSIKTYVIIKA